MRMCICFWYGFYNLEIFLGQPKYRDFARKMEITSLFWEFGSIIFKVFIAFASACAVE